MSSIELEQLYQTKSIQAFIALQEYEWILREGRDEEFKAGMLTMINTSLKAFIMGNMQLTETEFMMLITELMQANDDEMRDE